MSPPSLVFAIIATICIPRAFGADPVSLACSQPLKIFAPTADGGSTIIRDVEISITYQPDNVILHLYPQSQTVYARFRNSTLEIKGHTERENIYWASRGSISTTGTYIKGDNDALEVFDCRLYLSSNTNRKNVDDVIEAELRRVAASCLANEICKNAAENKHTKVVDYDVVKSKRSVASLGAQIITFGDIRLNLNQLVDSALEKLKQVISETGQNRISVPEIHTTFQTGKGIFKVNGQFDTNKGEFRDLTTLHRTSDVELEKIKKKYFAAAGFGLSFAHVQFDHYQLKFGPVKVKGQLMGNIDGINIDVGLSVNYDEKPCVKSIEYIKITDVGKIRIHVTGLGKLNNLMSKLVSWVTKQWKDTIINTVEKKLYSIIQKQVDKFNCEKYRPFAF